HGHDCDDVRHGDAPFAGWRLCSDNRALSSRIVAERTGPRVALLRPCAGCVAQEAVQVAAGREYERVAFGDDLLVGAHGFDEGVQVASLRALRVRGGVNAGG